MFYYLQWLPNAKMMLYAQYNSFDDGFSSWNFWWKPSRDPITFILAFILSRNANMSVFGQFSFGNSSTIVCNAWRFFNALASRRLVSISQTQLNLSSSSSSSSPSAPRTLMILCLDTFVQAASKSLQRLRRIQFHDRAQRISRSQIYDPLTRQTVHRLEVRLRSHILETCKRSVSTIVTFCDHE